jgi:predicted transposase/invertase (TIGR01784 family)
MNTIVNPHDKFFKEVFTRRETAEEFLRNYLPDDVVTLLDLRSLEYVKDSFIDKHLEEFYSDLLFTVFLKDGSRGYVYILLEHKSYQEPLTAFQLLRYMVKIWEMALKNREDVRFPVIIPVVLYHGAHRWRAGVQFRDLLDVSTALVPFIPDFQYVLWDASSYPDKDIKGAIILRVALLIFKYIFRPELRERLPGILGLFRELVTKRTGMEYLETVLRYILNAAPTGNISYEDLKAAVDEALPQRGGEIMLTIADTLIEQGMQQGMQQGILQKAQEDVIDILEARFEGVPQSLVKTIHDIHDPSLLKILHHKAIKVQSIEEFEHLLEAMMIG